MGRVIDFLHWFNGTTVTLVPGEEVQVDTAGYVNRTGKLDELCRILVTNQRVATVAYEKKFPRRWRKGRRVDIPIREIDSVAVTGESGLGHQYWVVHIAAKSPYVLQLPKKDAGQLLDALDSSRSLR